MSSWVQLLLVVLAACLRFGAAEGDPLPAALVELVRNSPISSIEDLQLLLLSDSMDEEDGTSAANGGHRLPRSLNAQLAQQALCKVRTEVVEVTRAMLDASNANFRLWPPCVEVQRCSGCCNSRSLRCVPVVTHTRYLQVLKIELINEKPVYGKAVVSVMDHVECRCQVAPVKKPARKQHGHPHRNQTLSQAQGQGQVKLHSKDELHQWDELKQNQRTHLEDLLDQHRSSRGDTFPPAEGYSLPGEDPSQLEEAVLFGPHWLHNSTGLQQTERGEKVEGKDGPNPDANKTVSPDNLSVDVGDGFPLNSSEGGMDEGNRGRDEGSQDNPEPVTQDPQTQFSPAQETFIEGAGSRLRPTKEPNPDPRGKTKRRNNETPGEERKELLLHKRLDEEKETPRQEQGEGDEKEDARHHQQGQRHHHHHHHHQTTTQTPETTATSTATTTTTTRKPSAPSGPRPPARPSQTRRRLRKNRKRISKAAMRAMLM